jgi:hypothetical protein
MRHQFKLNHGKGPKLWRSKAIIILQLHYNDILIVIT